jgi:hypothetical protein
MLPGAEEAPTSRETRAFSPHSSTTPLFLSTIGKIPCQGNIPQLATGTWTTAAMFGGYSRVSGSIFLQYCRNIFYTVLSNTVLDLFNLNKVASLPVCSCGILENL